LWSLYDWLVHSKEDFMSRRFRVYLPLALALPLALSGTFALGATAFAAGAAPPAPCTAATAQVQQLSSAVTGLGTALSATPPDPVKLGQSAGNLMDAVIAAVNAGCLPALPTPSGLPTPANAHQCLVDEVQLRQATLGIIAAGIATPPNLPAALQAATALASALTAINSDACLPVSLPVPTVPPAAPPV
jgi:hypothetical protein